jgi:hypothetical protein
VRAPGCVLIIASEAWRIEKAHRLIAAVEHAIDRAHRLLDEAGAPLLNYLMRPDPLAPEIEPSAAE